MKSWNVGPVEIRDLNFSAVAGVSLELAVVRATFEQYLGWTNATIFLIRVMLNNTLEVLRYSMVTT